MDTALGNRRNDYRSLLFCGSRSCRRVLKRVGKKWVQDVIEQSIGPCSDSMKVALNVSHSTSRLLRDYEEANFLDRRKSWVQYSPDASCRRARFDLGENPRFIKASLASVEILIFCQRPSVSDPSSVGPRCGEDSTG
ncbi:hypothetical protein Tco_0739181 [Tanacetum coccineum]